jgi:hypothetical protein
MKRGITVASAAGFRAQTRPPGTEFSDAETKRQKPSSKRANAGRDQNPRTEWPEIPAETLYLASRRKPAVCGDWMVAAAVVFPYFSADPDGKSGVPLHELPYGP